MSLPKEFLRRVEVRAIFGYDDYCDDGKDDPWNAWFHRFTEGTSRNVDSQVGAHAVVEREDGEVLVVPMSKYSVRFLDRTP